MLSFLKNANLALALLLEFGVLAALCYWGFSTGPTMLAKIGLGIGAPVVAIIVWALFGAPRSPRRLRGPWYWLLRIVFDALGVIALFATGLHALGLIFALVAILNCVLGYLWKQ